MRKIITALVAVLAVLGALLIGVPNAASAATPPASASPGDVSPAACTGSPGGRIYNATNRTITAHSTNASYSVGKGSYSPCYAVITSVSTGAAVQLCWSRPFVADPCGYRYLQLPNDYSKIAKQIYEKAANVAPANSPTKINSGEMMGIGYSYSGAVVKPKVTPKTESPHIIKSPSYSARSYLADDGPGDPFRVSPGATFWMPNSLDTIRLAKGYGLEIKPAYCDTMLPYGSVLGRYSGKGEGTPISVNSAVRGARCTSTYVYRQSSFSSSKSSMITTAFIKPLADASIGKVKNIDGNGDHIWACRTTAAGNAACQDLAPGQTSRFTGGDVEWVYSRGATTVCHSVIGADPCKQPYYLPDFYGTWSFYVLNVTSLNKINTRA